MFLTQAVEKRFHNSLETMSFVPESGFDSPNAYFNYIINKRKWTKLCAHPPQGVAPVVREFHANLPHKDDIKVFVKGIWVPFDSETVNRAFELKDGDSETYQNL